LRCDASIGADHRLEMHSRANSQHIMEQLRKSAIPSATSLTLIFGQPGSVGRKLWGMEKPCLRVTRWLGDTPVEAECTCCPGETRFLAASDLHRPDRADYEDKLRACICSALQGRPCQRGSGAPLVA
jgi:hypothetical protein